jgi:hypothetical protein
MLTRWAGWPAAILVTLLTIALVLGDLLDEGMRRWWSAHALTTDTVSGLLVLLITVLVADQLLSRQQSRNRARAVAAQAAIMVAQATRAGKAVAGLTRGSAGSGSGASGSGASGTGTSDAGTSDAGTSDADARDADARDAAADEVRTYMMMLLVGAPLLIEDPVARHFLEEAQHLAGVMAATLTTRQNAAGSGFDDAVARLRAASIPMLKSLNQEERVVANAEELLD